MPKPLNLVLEFGGGAELLFGNVKRHSIQLERDDSTHWTIRKLLVWIDENLLKERKELFIQGDSVRPGILVLVNEADWELMKDGHGEGKIPGKCFIPGQKDRAGKGAEFCPACVCVPCVEGQLDYELEDNDNIMFISTLHGG